VVNAREDIGEEVLGMAQAKGLASRGTYPSPEGRFTASTMHR